MPTIKQKSHIVIKESLGAAEESQTKEEEPSHDQQTSTNPRLKL
jgi:hypothetical protein